MERHVRVLAALLIYGGITSAVLGLLLVLRGVAVTKFLLIVFSTRMIMSVPFAAMYLTAIGWLHLLLVIPAVASGWGLKRYEEWARLMGLVVSLASILSFPFGTVFGIYGIWVLLSPESEYLFLEPPGTYSGK